MSKLNNLKVYPWCPAGLCYVIVREIESNLQLLWY